MKERPIIFSSAMVRAILDGRKTQTRRVIKPQPIGIKIGKSVVPSACGACAYGVPGDRLWVRETSIIAPKWWNDGIDCNVRDEEGLPRIVQYLATAPDQEAAKSYKLKVTPSIFMPRWASRITLEIAEVRVQRVQEISEEDAQAEGVEAGCYECGEVPHHPARLGRRDVYGDSFFYLWDSINAKRGYGSDSNPWVWAVTFRMVKVG